MIDIKKMTFVVACKTFFGLKENQPTVEFLKEVRALTPDDRDYLIREFKTVGIDATLTA